jgi:catechol 2,3-dioxygenase-like lactoylglutathione lyase family enzyme
LGLREVAKPPQLAERGGAWFENGHVKIHIGVDKEFRAARKAHVALLVEDVGTLMERCRSLGCEIVDDDPLAGFARVYVYDLFGNRLELMEPNGGDA